MPSPDRCVLIEYASNSKLVLPLKVSFLTRSATGGLARFCVFLGGGGGGLGTTYHMCDLLILLILVRIPSERCKGITRK
mgnify:CR=1 FL=1